jgi:hypothetical protein
MQSDSDVAEKQDFSTRWNRLAIYERMHGDGDFLSNDMYQGEKWPSSCPASQLIDWNDGLAPSLRSGYSNSCDGHVSHNPIIHASRGLTWSDVG